MAVTVERHSDLLSRVSRSSWLAPTCPRCQRCSRAVVGPALEGGGGRVSDRVMRLASCMDIQALVVRDGDRVTASGRLVRVRDGDWFQPELPHHLMGGVERQVAGPWRGAVHITGASFEDLTNRLERDGAVEGYAKVTGTWSDGQLHVIHQATPQSTSHPHPRWESPPCPAPAGGWPHLDWEHASSGRGVHNLDYDLGDLEDTGAAVAVTTFRPSEDQAVLVVAAADRDAVEAQLRPQLGDLLCVVTSDGPRPNSMPRARICTRTGNNGTYTSWAHRTARTAKPEWLPSSQGSCPKSPTGPPRSRAASWRSSPGSITQTRSLLIRRFLCGHPEPFRSVRDLGCFPGRRSCESGKPQSRSAGWLPAWLPGVSAERLTQRPDEGFRFRWWRPSAPGSAPPPRLPHRRTCQVRRSSVDRPLMPYISPVGTDRAKVMGCRWSPLSAVGCCCCCHRCCQLVVLVLVSEVHLA